MNKPKILIIAGPTAVGKTSFGIKCAKMFNGEIISSDCIQIYKDLSIGSAKPTEKELKEAKHHLIDFVDSKDTFNASLYRDKARKIILDLEKKGKLPIIVGGTGLYLKSLLFPISLGKSAKDKKIRDKYNELAKKHGKEHVYEILAEIDPASAEKLHPNDIKRVVRALEIYEVTGVKKSDQVTDDYSSMYDYTFIVLYKDRKELYNDINKRVDIMINSGLENEFYNLLDLGLNRTHQSMSAIGYKEFFDYTEKKVSIEDTIDNIKQNSRRYAKRQFTFFKTFPNAIWLNVLDEEEVDSTINKLKDKF